jgi:hypothetical protein
MPFWSRPAAFIKSLWEKISEIPRNIPPGQRRIILVCCGAALVVILFLLVLLLVVDHRRSAPPDTGQELRNALGPRSISPEELFLPEEPEFLPDVLLNRDPAPWTAADARPFWTDPLEGGEELWLERIETVIDDLLEHIP